VRGHCAPRKLGAPDAPRAADVLAGRKTVGAISGKVLYGGHHASKNFLRRYTGYVEQFGARRAPRRPAARSRSARRRGPCSPARGGAARHCMGPTRASARADALVENLTVFEMLLYTAEMKVDMRVPFRQKCRKVQAVVDQLALNTCRDTRIGSQVARGISGARPCRRPADLPEPAGRPHY
jgi:ATP-binding cassette subfamily G (WHITE) protein 2